MAQKTKAELSNILNTNITDPLNKQNTAARVREIIQDVIDSLATLSGSNQFNGNQIITGSLIINGGITGSLNGTASYASTALSASYALNANSASYALSSSYASTALSSSYAATASYALSIPSNLISTSIPPALKVYLYQNFT